MKILIRARIILIVLVAILPALIDAQDGNTPPVVINGISRPGNFPPFSPTINEETAPGKIFITNSEGAPYLMILENDGTPYFYQQLDEPSLDFKVQTNGMLSRWIGGDERGYIVMDQHFQNVDTLRCMNGFGTDEHEFLLLQNGHALLIAIEERPLTQIDPDGNPNTTVIGNHIQELDENGMLVFEWLCWDHINLEDSNIENQDVLELDYIHMNSIAMDYDGHLLISSRHLSECTKINRQTGEIIWRLGGKNNQFDFINDPDLISSQHDFRPVPDKPGHYTLFDNGTQKDPKYSRAVEFKLDTVNMLAEKVWEYRHIPDRYSRIMGNAQRLPNGNTLINWGDPTLPKITEVTDDSIIVYEADFTPAMNNYKTFRFEFDGSMLAPNLVAEPYPDRVRLLFNKFGDKGVDYYNIYGGKSPESLVWIDSTSLTWIDLTDLEASTFFYLEVTAMDTSGLESPPSKLEKVYVRNSEPGDNLIINGDFSDDYNFWTHINDREASSSGSISDSTYLFNIENAGLLASDVQLYQANIPLIKGKEYILELDARADAGRTINVELQRAGSNWVNYSRHGHSYITGQFTHIAHTFTMEKPNDLKANMVINGGGSGIDFEVKNISLRQTVVSGTPQKVRAEAKFLCYPNPANKELKISFELESSSDIHMQLFTLTGQLVKTIYRGRQDPGHQEIIFNTEKLASGAYMLHLSNESFSNSRVVLIQH
jgi:hypothetical protein